MAFPVTRISHKVAAYRAVAKPAPTPETAIGGIAPAGAVPGTAGPRMPEAGQPTPYVNTRGETTGTVVNTQA